VPLALWTGNLDSAEAGIAALRRNFVYRTNTVWRRLARFFEAALRHARGERAMLAEMGESLDDLLALGFVVRSPLYLAMLAEALLDDGQLVDARARIDDAASRLEQYQELWCRPEILRIQGLVEAAYGNGAAAQARLADAIADADAIGALTFELRAACDLARALAADGCRNAARGVLGSTCAKFTEDGAGREIIAARALLDTLNRD
jgi:predicted ATPase